MALAYETVNPATGEPVRRFEHATDEQVSAAINHAAERYRLWRHAPLAERTTVLTRAAHLYRERAEELAGLVSLEMGKPISQARGEMAVSADIFDYYATNAAEFTAEQQLSVRSGGTAVVRTEPIGVLLGIMPWNYPHYQVARFAAPNLALGNTILIKHAANCPQSAIAIEELLRDAGLPEGAYINLFATHDQVSRIIADPRVAGISLTGSERAGAIVAEQAGRHLKKVVLELGGNDPFIVLDDHDLRETARAAVTGRMSNAGQACTSPKRFIVLDAVYEQFVAAVEEEIRAIEPGDPLDPTTRFGPVSTFSARAELLEQIEDAVAGGATLRSGGHAVDGPGSYLAPTLLTDLTPGMRAWSEELFGPVASIFRVADIDAAIELANDSPYGLGAAVFGRDTEQTRYVAERLEAGMVYVGGNSDSEADLPFGGVKRSGFGRELGPRGMDEFANKKLIRTF
ncbi:NAD-dependent succinate-semialdehyde dehydrogenase [Nocardia sp. NPDC004860]|uniref:NAD-dependent succinate-semialdehyde dehydrogenase n=1 Tax=Nocardia sp. NPDC004860 TaxID=3154557 RepID=UPI0033B1B9FD